MGAQVNCLGILCALYIDAGVVAMHQIQRPTPTWSWYYDRNQIRNPYGVIAIGLEYDLTARLSARLELRHESSIATPHDLGENSAGVFVRWRPFQH